MKRHSLYLGLLSLSTLLPFAPSFTPLASAQCVAVDVSNQMAMHGSQNEATQINDINQNLDHGCLGAGIGTYNAQTGVSNDNVTQVRDANTNVNSTLNNIPNAPGIGNEATNINISVDTAQDIYNPALYPSFVSY
jgi:hypothetical protein